MKITPRWTEFVTALKKHVTRIARQVNERSHGWLGVLWIATQQTLKPETSVMASAIAYFSLFSLFPLILLSISIASLRLGPDLDQHVIVTQLEFIAPALNELLGENIDRIIQARGTVSTVALISLIWSASSVFYTLTHTLNELWHKRQSRAAWKRRGLAILFVLAFVGPTLFLISMAGSVLSNLRYWLPNQILPFRDGISLVLTILLDVTLFMALYMMLPHGTSKWREILPGAIAAGLLWEFAKKVFLIFISTYISISNLVYGTVAVIIAFLAWAYFSSLIFLFGAYVSVSYWEHKQK